MTTAKYDHGFGIQVDQWADNGDVFDVEYLVFDDNGDKLSYKDPKFSKRLKLKDAIKAADKIKKDFDAYKVLVVQKGSNNMLARLTSKGPAKRELPEERLREIPEGTRDFKLNPL